MAGFFDNLGRSIGGAVSTVSNGIGGVFAGNSGRSQNANAAGWTRAPQVAQRATNVGAAFAPGAMPSAVAASGAWGGPVGINGQLRGAGYTPSNALQPSLGGRDAQRAFNPQDDETFANLYKGAQAQQSSNIAPRMLGNDSGMASQLMLQQGGMSGGPQTALGGGIGMTDQLGQYLEGLRLQYMRQMFGGR